MIPDVIAGAFRANPIDLSMAYGSVEEGKFEQAESYLKKLERGPPRPLLTSEIAYVRALIAERQGKTEEALAKYRAIVAGHPNTPDAYLARKKIGELTKSPAAGGERGL